MLDEFARGIQMIAGAMAERAGRDPAGFAVRNLAGAAAGVMMSAVLGAADGTPTPASMFESIDTALRLLEAGLPL